MQPVSTFYFLLISLSVLVKLESKVCRNVDVRNTPENINQFRDCTVIEGKLQFVLIERADEASFVNKSFPHLYEITDQLIVFRVSKLKSLASIFPKLRVIGGNNLFHGYSLILFSLPDMEEIGLTSLQTIKKGAVKIGKCPKLCYVDTINWEALGASYLNIDRSSKCRNEFCPEGCAGRCWNRFSCQSMIEDQCHRFCVGCTKYHSPKHCDVCKYYNDSGTCVQTCPDHKVVENSIGECLKPEECASKNGSWSILNKTCIPECPSLYERDSKGDCIFTGKKFCNGTLIEYEYEFGILTNCTHINNSLELSLVEDISTSVLENAFGTIVYIAQYLKITRSRSITSLGFLKSLKHIGGQKLYSEYYALFIAMNPNLETLWGHDDVVVGGEALFQDNPNLCGFEIEKLKNISRYSSNNGYNTCCDFRNLSVKVTDSNPTNVTVTWKIPKKREKVIGYVIYYAIKDFARKNIVHDYCRDPEDTRGYEWNTIFVSNNSVQLKGLVTTTTYVYYIKTLLTPKGFIKTPLNYFQTEISDPSEPLDLVALSKNETAIELTWKPPGHTYGNLSHYTLAVYFQEDYLPTIRQRNYCLHPHHICSCPVKEEIRIFLSNDTCIGNNSHFCNEKAYYSTDEPYTSVIKLDSRNTSVQEFDIPSVNQSSLSALVTSLRHFTMYTFYLRACNQNGTEHCGAPAMTFRRTCECKSADVVKTIHIQAHVADAVITWTKPEEPNSETVAYHIEYKRTDLKKSASKSKCLVSWEWERDGNVTYRLTGLERGKYQLRVLAVSLAGAGQWSRWEGFEISYADSGVIWGCGLLGASLIVLAFAIWRWYKSKRGIDDSDYLIPRTKLSEDEDEWTMDDETVQIVRELEQNFVGMMYRNN